MGESKKPRAERAWWDQEVRDGREIDEGRSSLIRRVVSDVDR